VSSRGQELRQKPSALNSNSADDSITKPGSDYVFRVGQNTDAYAKLFFALFKQLGTIKTIAILVSNNDVAPIDVVPRRSIWSSS